MDPYKHKYMKYKTKYTNLRNRFRGGGESIGRGGMVRIIATGLEGRIIKVVGEGNNIIYTIRTANENKYELKRNEFTILPSEYKTRVRLLSEEEQMES